MLYPSTLIVFATSNSRKHKIDLAGRKFWCDSGDPEFIAKAADVVRAPDFKLYLDAKSRKDRARMKRLLMEFQTSAVGAR
jgi:hypothetical protein